MRKETIKIYKFEELTKDIQEKVIDNNRDWNTDISDWYEFVIENWIEKLNCIGFEDAKINFSHMYCQGQGASFESNIKTDKIFSHMVYDIGNDIKYTDLKEFEKFINLMDKNLIEFSFWSKRVSNHYSHENTCIVDSEIDLYLKNCSLKAEEWFYNTFESIRDSIESYRYDLCKNIMQNLIKEYEYQSSNEAIKESIICNEIEFTKDGKIY